MSMERSSEKARPAGDDWWDAVTHESLRRLAAADPSLLSPVGRELREYARARAIIPMECIAVGIKHEPHKWDFGGAERFWCTGSPDGVIPPASTADGDT